VHSRRTPGQDLLLPSFAEVGTTRLIPHSARCSLLLRGDRLDRRGMRLLADRHQIPVDAFAHATAPVCAAKRRS
jgi:hypothetical protein